MNSSTLRLSRRQLMLGATGAALYATLPGISAAASAQGSLAPQFTDPLEALRAHVKLVGSLGNEQVISFYRLNIYADLNHGEFVPLMTMNNILVDNWTVRPDGSHQMIKYEAGYYTHIDSHEPISVFRNPVNGAESKIQNFRLGPVPRGYSKDGYTVMGFHPNPLPLEVIAGRVFLATQSIETSPSFTNPSEKRYTNSFMTYSAALEDMQNPELASAPVHAQLQNKTEWLPYMKMGDQPGGTVVRGFGGKLENGFDSLPAGVLEQYKRQLPQILETENWTSFVSEMTDAE
ncbi:MAG: DUF1838 family protein [Pseudomonadota bacterium]